MSRKSKILIVDDSRCFRSALKQVLAGYDDIVVVGSVFSGPRALEFIRNSPPDLVTLDVTMPGMDGLETLRAIQQFNASRPDSAPVGVIMVSVSTSEGAQVTAEALQQGALTFVHKPQGDTVEASVAALAQQLVGKIRQYGPRGRRRQQGVSETGRQGDRETPAKKVRPYRAVVIAVSTGGPQALAQILPELCERIDLPILVAQHMPREQPEMMTNLVKGLAAYCSHPVIEARDGGPVLARMVYFAPGGKHLLVRHGPNGQVITSLTDQPQENNFWPSANALFRSAHHVWGGDVVAVVLTGMLDDGTRGLEPLKRAGAHVIVQNKATSVTWGMPESAVLAGLVDEVLPLDQIPAAIEAAVQAGRRS